ncbi:MAG: hypothetical protein BMS9Abin07_1805 [Acidimicrobiia bacterium]|nr:MAG: hypothetical protein BMS9Abin07_1805 [Acidimicrobiia bacterium]
MNHDEAVSTAEGLLGVGQPDRAEEMVRIALAGAPKDPKLLELLVLCLAAQDRDREALAAAHDFAAAAPNDWFAQALVADRERVVAPGDGHPEMHQRRVKKVALPVARRAVELAPNQPVAYLVLGRSLLDAVRPPTFVSVRLRLPLGDPGDRKRLREASAVAERCLELAPNWAPAHLLAADVARRRFRIAEADGHMQRALELDPTGENPLRSAVDAASGVDARRYATRLAATRPSFGATELVVVTHRATPQAFVVFPGLFVASWILSAVAGTDDLIGEPALALWVGGPAIAIGGAAWLLRRRKRLLSAWAEEVVWAILAEEDRWKWIRRASIAVLAIFPLLWFPASIIGAHAGAWASSWVFIGVLVGVGYRPRATPPGD